MLCNGRQSEPDSKALPMPSGMVATPVEIDATTPFVPQLAVIRQYQLEPSNGVPLPQQNFAIQGALPLPTGPFDRDYRMDHPKRGKCHIFNHTTYYNPSLRPRDGSQMDVEMLRQCFGGLRFDVEVHNDKHRKELLDLFENSRSRSFDTAQLNLH